MLTSSFTQLDILSHFHPLDSEEPKCAVCLESCSQANTVLVVATVHTLCGIQVAGCEGYGAPVWCPNLSGEIIESSGDGYYKIGTAAGTLDRSIYPQRLNYSALPETGARRDRAPRFLSFPDLQVSFVCGAMALIFPRAPRFADYPGLRGAPVFGSGLYLIPIFFNLEMYLKLLSHSDKQFFPLLSERTGCIEAAPVAVIPTGISLDELRILAILSAIAN